VEENAKSIPESGLRVIEFAFSSGAAHRQNPLTCADAVPRVEENVAP
jgi:hypothetical protein